jgi:hypothetical protein
VTRWRQRIGWRRRGGGGGLAGQRRFGWVAAAPGFSGGGGGSQEGGGRPNRLLPIGPNEGTFSSSPFLCASPSADQEDREGEIERADAWPQRVDDLGLSFSRSLLLQSESPFLTHHSELKKPRGAGPLPFRHQRPHHRPWR